MDSANTKSISNGKPAQTGRYIFSIKNEKLAASRIQFQKFYDENRIGEVPADGITLPRAVFHAPPPPPPTSDAGYEAAPKDPSSPKFKGHSGLTFPLSPPASEVASVDVPIIENGSFILPHQDGSTVNMPHCKFFLRPKGCMRTNCPYLHDYNRRFQVNLERKRERACRKAEAVPKVVVPMAHVNLDTYDDNPAAVATYTGVVSKNVVVTLPPPAKVAPEKNDWSERMSDLEMWARANIRDRAQFMLLVPFFSSNVLPSNFLAGYGKSNMVVNGPVFELFPLLPGELRNKIWDHAMVDQALQSRNVRIRWVELQKGDLVGDGIGSKTFAPPILHANHESRSLALPYFKRAFSCKGYYTFFNYDLDRLFIHTTGPGHLRTMVGLISTRNLERIKDLTLSVKEFAGDYTAYKTEFCSRVTKFKNLENLTLLIGDGVQDSYWLEKMDVLDRAYCYLNIGWKTRWGLNQVLPFTVRVKRIEATYAHSLEIDDLIYT